MRHPTRWIALGAGLIVVAFAVVLALNVQSHPTTSEHAHMVGRQPSLRLTTLDGAPISADALRGKVVLVNFWNTWCIPCEQELPALKEFYARHADDPDFEMIGVVHDEDDTDNIRSYVPRQGMDWTIALDHNARTGLEFGVTGQPETYALAADGRVVAEQFSPTRVEDLELMLAVARGA